MALPDKILNKPMHVRYIDASNRLSWPSSIEFSINKIIRNICIYRNSPMHSLEWKYDEPIQNRTTTDSKYCSQFNLSKQTDKVNTWSICFRWLILYNLKVFNNLREQTINHSTFGICNTWYSKLTGACISQSCRDTCMILNSKYSFRNTWEF